MDIVGREKERQVLQELLETPKAEFLALYGRRRVGKTFLIHQFYRDKGIYFELTGIKGVNKALQLKNFAAEYVNCFHQLLETIPRDWMDAFARLQEQVEKSAAEHIILFFDELPWLASRRSGFLQALDHLWNRHLSRDPRVILIVCGSAASWMIKKIIHNRAGLHGRLTRQMRLLPYTLQETEVYLNAHGITLDRKQVAEIYMAIGGIPKYLSEVPRGKSAAQIIQHLCFDPRKSLSSEFRRLYESLFDGASKHIAIVRLLAKHRSGLQPNEITERLPKLSRGGAFSDLLMELEQAGFIMAVPEFGQKKKNTRYLLTDEYSLFYLTWIEPLMGPGVRPINSQYWHRQYNTPSYRSWAGYSFEALCLKHIDQLIKALQLAVVATSYAGWRKAGAQIDLIIERADHCINLCEIKFSDSEFVMTEDYANKLDQKKRIFEENTRTKHALFTTLIAANGAKRNAHYLGSVENLLTLDDLYL